MLTDLKRREETSWLKEVDSVALQKKSGKPTPLGVGWIACLYN